MTVALRPSPDLLPVASAPVSPDWVLRVPTDGSLPSVTGGPFTSHAGRHAFLAGFVFPGPAANGVPLPLDGPRGARFVLQQIAQREDAAWPDLRGRFVVAVHDPATATTRVARDPLGSHSLFYALTSGAVLFAASPRLLLQQTGVPSTLNRVAIADHLCKRWPDRQETLFEAVRRIPFGWEAVISRRGLDTHRYWHPSGDRIDWLPDEEVARFDDLLDQAVGRGLSTGSAGVFLSGGFDSVSVAAVAADLASRAGHRPPVALSLGFPDPACDERVIQTSVASALATPLHLAPFFEAAGPRGLLGEGLALNAGLSAPLFNNWMPAYLSLVRYARRRDVTVLFTGEGGDEWLGATPFFGADLLRLGQIGGLVRMARTWKRSFHQDWLTVLRGTLWRYSLRPLAGLWCHRLAPDWWDERRARKVSRATPDWISPDPALRALQHVRARAGLAQADPRGGFYSRESRLFLDDPLTTRLFEEQHELVRDLGVRFVHPYWDPDLVAHMYRVRPERLNEHDRSKAVVRQTLARRFPQLGFERQRKVAALGFFTSILRRDAPVLGAQVADFSGLAGLGIVRPDAARRFLERAWCGTAREMGEAWNLVNTEVWIRAQQRRLPEQPQRKDESR